MHLSSGGKSFWPISSHILDCHDERRWSRENLETMVGTDARNVHRCWLFRHQFSNGPRCTNEGGHVGCMLLDCTYLAFSDCSRANGIRLSCASSPLPFICRMNIPHITIKSTYCCLTHQLMGGGIVHYCLFFFRRTKYISSTNKRKMDVSTWLPWLYFQQKLFLFLFSS